MSKIGFIAVTGGTGFVGHHVIRALLTEGYNVKALARSPSKLSDITDDKLTVIQGNLKAVDASFLKGASTVLHMAGLIKAQTREDIMLVNRDGAGAVASAAQEVGVPRFVLMSSQTAGQPQLSDYAASKYAGEIAVKEAYQGTLAIIRAPAVIGPRDEATKPFFDFIQKGKLPVAGGKGWKDRKLAMVFVTDLAKDIAIQAVNGAHDGRIVVPATIGVMTWPEFAEYCTEAMGFPVKTIPIPMPIIRSIAACTSFTSRAFNKGHLTLGKLREFLYEDWSSQDVIPNPTPFIEALQVTAASYEKE